MVNQRNFFLPFFERNFSSIVLVTNLSNMRVLLISLFVLFFGALFGQVETLSEDSEKEEKYELEEHIIEKDTIFTETEEMAAPMENKGVDKKQKRLNNLSTSKSRVDSDEGLSGSSQLYKSSSNKFNSSKNQSSYQRTQRSPSVTQQEEMNDAVGYFEKNSPNSFEYHYFKYVSGNYDIGRFYHLQQAEKLRKNNSDVHVQMAAYHMIRDNKGQASSYMNKLIGSKRLSSNIIKYAEDILLSVPRNGTLITHGFDDSYATWHLQSQKNIRTDVQLISLDFMQSEYYREQLKKKGYRLPDANIIDVSFFAQFCKLNASRNLSASLTMPKEYFKPILLNVYVVGLVFEYHTERYENFVANERLWNSRLKKHLINNVYDEKSKHLSSNYLPMLLQMRKVYGQKGEVDKVKEMDRVIDKIGAQCKKYDQVQKLKSAY